MSSSSPLVQEAFPSYGISSDPVRGLRIVLYNCDNTVDLSSTVAPLVERSKIPNVQLEYKSYRISEMQTIVEELKDVSDYIGIIVLHANESRLSINEPNTNIGYSKIFKALKVATNNHVLVVISGDSEAKDNLLISLHIKAKISGQFSLQQIDGPESYVFSWKDRPTDKHVDTFKKYVHSCFSNAVATSSDEVVDGDLLSTIEDFAKRDALPWWVVFASMLITELFRTIVKDRTH